MSLIKETNIILVWQEGSINPTMVISGNFTNPTSIFVTSNGDIYIDDVYVNSRVQKMDSKKQIALSL